VQPTAQAHGRALLVAIVVALCVVVVGCSPSRTPLLTDSAAPGSSSRTPLLTYSLVPGSSPGGVVVEGMLALSPNSRCIVLEVADAAPIGLLWPAGFSVMFEPLRIYDDRGIEVGSDSLGVEIGGDVQFTRSEDCQTESSMWVYRISHLDSRPAS
jgi:hypothetical protein